MDIERLRYLLGTVLVRGMSGEYSEIITAFTALKQENTLWGTEVERLCAEVERLKDNLAYHRKRADYEKERTDKAEAALERIVGPIRGIDKDSSWWDGSTENYGKHLKSMHAAFDHIEQEKPPEEQERDRLKDTDQYREGMKDYEAFWSSRWQDWRTRAKAAEANCNTYLGDFQKLEGELSAEMERATVAEAALERVVGPIRELRNLWKSTPLHNYHAFGRETPEDHGPPELGWYESILSNRELRYKIAPVIRDYIEQEKPPEEQGTPWPESLNAPLLPNKPEYLDAMRPDVWEALNQKGDILPTSEYWWLAGWSRGKEIIVGPYLTEERAKESLAGKLGLTPHKLKTKIVERAIEEILDNEQ